MRSRRVSRIARAAAAAALLLSAGCSAATHSASGDADAQAGPAGDAAVARPALAMGPGPQPTYTVQRQPAPGTCHYRADHGQPLPDPACTPGALSPAVTTGTLRTTICRPGGYTSTIRPPAAVTGAEKRANARSYAYTGSPHDAEYDHLVPLSLGGDPNDPRNLWVEPPSPGHQAGAGVNNPKDALEEQLHTAVCSGHVPLAAAQKAIATDWATADQKLGLPPAATGTTAKSGG
ncbi:hypothetical protein [Phaeacidiphilus oryzae]|uniref:hypothetical protein n=1 Tax=Phaeacidiphilus oryzae TaxID=348818 RepID=UPI0006918280|nr:hypothetical protein [Phaeacidiphilus oryzae]